MSEGTQRRLAAIVSADVVGYSRLMGADEAGTHARLKARFSELVEPKIVEHGGRLVKLMGDGLLAEFSSAVDAVNWAVAVQTKIAELNAGASDETRIDYRVGVNLGDIIVDQDDIFGDGVNVAARLQEIAEPGGVCISQKVHVEVHGKLAVEFADGGSQSVKNIAQPIHVWHWQPGGQEAVQDPAVEQVDALQLPDKPSIAVLPFDNMSGDPEQEYFTDGITEDIITGISKLRWLFVIARNSSFVYKGQGIDVTQVSRELGVRYVLEGSVRRAGNRIRINAQLLDATTGMHVWAERYDRELVDIFDLQDEITANIVTAIGPEVTLAEIERARRKRPENLDAWDQYLRALPLIHQIKKEAIAEAKKQLQLAIKLDPNFVAAHAALAWFRA